MAKVFTIAPGLENMGALRTGGQGSVYKGRRIGEIITAIKLLPTPIYNESEDDKNYRDFQNEVEKLKRVNEHPNPHVVEILSFGLSETGNFPYIEMDYIEGPDLEDLLKPPHDPVFTIKEVIKVAEQLSSALSHCHKLDVRHGDVKSNNVKYNLHTGNYVLLDFGLAIMSDEQRRTSLRRAGAVEFMAPEQNEGQMLFQTDVYSFGVVIFELLSGRVPFPLEDKGETARNNIRLSHLETKPPDVIELRRKNLPSTWSEQKKDREMGVPEWLVTLIYKCLQKKPEDRFSNGVELYEFIIYNSIHTGLNVSPVQSEFVQEQSEKLQNESVRLQQEVTLYKEQLLQKEMELSELKTALRNSETQSSITAENVPGYADSPKPGGVSRSAFLALLLLTICLAAFSAYTLIKSNGDTSAGPATVDSTSLTSDTAGLTTFQETKKPALRKKDSLLQVKRFQDSIRKGAKKNPLINDSSKAKGKDENQDGNPANDQEDDDTDATDTYIPHSKAFFYNEPNENSRRGNVHINRYNKPVTATDDLNGFIYVVYTNEQGVTTRGWLRKKDLRPVHK